jgi:glycosyltransferase involved in cell wall biosynthesis
MRINFVLPFPSRVPGGGTKVMYEYANKLTAKGHTVFFYHAIRTSYFTYRIPYFIRFIYFTYFETRLPKWFPLDKRIRSINIPCVDNKYISDADIIISSWWATAEEINKLSPSKGKKFNLIQDYEVWTGNEAKVHESYRLPATKVVYVQYLKKIIEREKGSAPHYIPIGIDRSKFFSTTTIEAKNPFSLCMMYSEEPRKGTQYGLEALAKLKQVFPQLEATLFGVFPKPADLAPWIKYVEKPSNLNDIYNSSAIYITPSLQEGWALPPAEAMICGCALVCSDIPGHMDYAFNNETALIFKTKDADDIVLKVSELLNDQNKRIEMAKKGNDFVQKYDWVKAVDSLEKLFLESI